MSSGWEKGDPNRNPWLAKILINWPYVIVNCYWCPVIFKYSVSHDTVCYLYSLHPDFYTLVNIINIET
jgi:hypothetical protein